MFIKQFTADDWQSYKALRLEALSLHEDVFGGSYKLESAWSDAQWQYNLSKQDRAYFGLYTDQKDLIGITGVVTDQTDKSGRTALLIASYIREKHRGQKLSRFLYAARIDWIVNSGRYDCIAVGHKQGNEASRRANQNFGFQHTGQEEKIWGDGSKGILHKYEMRIT